MPSADSVENTQLQAHNKNNMQHKRVRVDGATQESSEIFIKIH